MNGNQPNYGQGGPRHRLVVRRPAVGSPAAGVRVKIEAAAGFAKRDVPYVVCAPPGGMKAGSKCGWPCEKGRAFGSEPGNRGAPNSSGRCSSAKTVRSNLNFGSVSLDLAVPNENHLTGTTVSFKGTPGPGKDDP